VRRGADIPQILRLLGAIFRVREARRNEIRSQPSVESQHGETLGLIGRISSSRRTSPVAQAWFTGGFDTADLTEAKALLDMQR